MEIAQNINPDHNEQYITKSNHANKPPRPFV